MKKLINTFIFAFFIGLLSVQSAQAQSQITLPRDFEFGLRIGDTRGGALAFDATLPLRKNRLRANLGITDGLSLTGLYDWTFDLPDNFLWYLGAGAVMDFENDLDLAAVGEIGIEYKFFEVPIAFGIDWRPAIELTDDTRFNGDGFGINIRYRF